jgi:hypothetical protein
LLLHSRSHFSNWRKQTPDEIPRAISKWRESNERWWVFYLQSFVSKLKGKMRSGEKFSLEAMMAVVAVLVDNRQQLRVMLRGERDE